MQFDLRNVCDFLSTISLTYIDIENQLVTYSLTFPKYKNDIVEHGAKFPMFNVAFYDYVKQYNRIPTQSEYIAHWFVINEQHPSVKMHSIDSDIRYGLECRMNRLYPSLVRDIHFALLLKSKVKGKDSIIFYDINMDLENDIDVGIIINKKCYALNLYINTDRSMAFRSKKVFRHNRFDNVQYLELPKQRTTSHMVGNFYLYGIDELKLVNQKLKDLTRVES